MKYIKKFDTVSAQTEYLASAELDTYVGYVGETQDVYYDDAIPTYKDRYFTIKSLTDNNMIRFKKGSGSNVTHIYLSRDNGNSWSMATPQAGSNQTIATLNTGEKLLIKGENTKYNYSRFSASGQFEVYGNIMSLISGDSFANADTITDTDALSGLFSGCTGLISAENLILPATTLGERCYKEMFHYCASLTKAPALPATTLANNCYTYMFKGCTSLTAAPALPATTLASECYENMFQDCTSLTKAPVLPATRLERYSYYSMFYGCTNLTKAPELPATTLAEHCYQYMFLGCTSLTTAPELPATTLASYCYGNMFNGCTSLNYIKCLATDISASYCTYNLLSNVASTGTFVKAASMSSWTTGADGIPIGWTVQNDDGSPVDNGGD